MLWHPASAEVIDNCSQLMEIDSPPRLRHGVAGLLVKQPAFVLQPRDYGVVKEN